MSNVTEMSNRIMDYRNKLILAPMVRIGTLPMRLLSLEFGAEIVYCEEVIDFKMLKCRRSKNEVLDTIDYTMDDGTVVFRTCSAECGKVVFQIGTADANRALMVAKMIEDDVAAIDINMGCPKEFSIKGGMGAALLSRPETIKKILTTLVNGVSKPVTCKIRILPTIEDTIQLAKLIESCGVAAIAIHGRLREERPNDANHDDVISIVASALSIPVIANGGSSKIQQYQDIKAFRASTGCSSVMLARVAQWNPSIFSKEGMRPIDEVIKKYIRYAVQYCSPVSNVKYCIQQLLHDNLTSDLGCRLLSTLCVRDICNLWELGEFYDQTIADQEAKRLSLRPATNQLLNFTSSVDGLEYVEMPFRYDRKQIQEYGQSPKFILNQWAVMKGLNLPNYETVGSLLIENTIFQYQFYITDLLRIHGGDQGYRNGLFIQGRPWEKSKKFAEQVAAAVCIESLRLQPDAEDFICRYARLSKVNNKCNKFSNDSFSALPQRRQLSNDDLLANSHFNKRPRPQGCPSIDESLKVSEDFSENT